MIPTICLTKIEKPINKPTFQFLMQYVSTEKQKRILRQHVKQNADNMLIGAVLAKYMIWKEFDVSFSEQIIAYGPYGKPYLRDYPDVHFNISHSGQFVACAVCNVPVGIDIQEIVPYKPDVARRVCTADEISQIEASMNPAAEFTKIWTQKEAILKMNGYGISEGISHLHIFSNTQLSTYCYDDLYISICNK